MPLLAVKNQALTRWFSFVAPPAEAIRQVIRFAKIAYGGMTHWGR